MDTKLAKVLLNREPLSFSLFLTSVGRSRYCDDNNSGPRCYDCSWIEGNSCDAIAGDCCSDSFLAQCKHNPPHCATCNDALKDRCEDMACTFACANCAGEHQALLQEAGGDNAHIVNWCAKV